MKTFLIAAMLTASLVNTAHAQTSMSTETKVMTKAEKDAAKAKKEAELMEAFSKAGLTADEQVKYRAAMDAGNEKTKPIKADAALSDAEKKEKVDAIYKERNENLKSILGDTKYRALKAVQKAQREAAGTVAP